MITIIFNLVIIVILIFTLSKLNKLDKDLSVKLKVSVVLFALGILYSIAIQLLMPSISTAIFQANRDRYTFWIEVINSLESVFLIVALLNLIPILRDHQFYRKNSQ